MCASDIPLSLISDRAFCVLQVKNGQDTSSTAVTTKLRFEAKRESPLDLSVKTVCRSADSTDDRLHPFGHDIPKVNFKPDFNACRVPQLTPLSGTAAAAAQPQLPSSKHVNVAAYNQLVAAPLTLPPPLPPTVASPQLHNMHHHQPPSALPVSVPIAVHQQQNRHLQTPAAASSVISSAVADDSWRAAIDKQIEQKFNSYTSSKKQQQPPQQQQSPAAGQPQQGPAQADKRVLEILKQNIEARDQSAAAGGGRPQIAEAPSTPAMVFSTPVRKEPSTTPLKKTDYYYNMAAERTAVATPFPKKIDYYMDRAYSNAPRIRTKAERKQVSCCGANGFGVFKTA